MSMNNRSDKEHRYTSTGMKFWTFPEKLDAYRLRNGRSVISTHISPEGACNLKCPYCSVTHRKVWNRIDLEVIKDYVDRLQSRGLLAVILTGGGEPTTYPKFNDLLEWLLEDRGLKVALISNGTRWKNADTSLMRKLQWLRISVNIFDGWEEEITCPPLTDTVTFGMSYVFTNDHEGAGGQSENTLRQVVDHAHRLGAEYLRVLPDCQLVETDLCEKHKELDAAIMRLGDPIVFRQDKHHRPPKASVCHQSYFRPYLSEEVHPVTGTPGSVFPCDSVVLNDRKYRFAEEYALCPPEKILEYLDGKIAPRFDPRKACKGCVFADTVDMLDEYVQHGTDRFDDVDLSVVTHREFV